MVNVLKFWTLFSFSSQWNVGCQWWNSQNASQNSKQGRPWSDCFFRSSLIWVCTVCQGLFSRQSSLICVCTVFLCLSGRQLVFKIFNICPIFFSVNLNACFRCSKECHIDVSSFEYPQYMFNNRIKSINFWLHTLLYRCLSDSINRHA